MQWYIKILYSKKKNSLNSLFDGALKLQFKNDFSIILFLSIHLQMFLYHKMKKLFFKSFLNKYKMLYIPARRFFLSTKWPTSEQVIHNPITRFLTNKSLWTTVFNFSCHLRWIFYEGTFFLILQVYFIENHYFFSLVIMWK